MEQSSKAQTIWIRYVGVDVGVALGTSCKSHASQSVKAVHVQYVDLNVWEMRKKRPP